MVKFPYMKMQQLNLDWLMEYVKNMPVLVHLPALAGSTVDNLTDMIDNQLEYIPDGVCFLEFGQTGDDKVRRGACMVYKQDDDNMILFTMSFAPAIGNSIYKKDGGEWS